jgi:hypothetical protein
MSPPRWREAGETGDDPPLRRKLATMAANPRRIKIMALHLWDSITTITRTARTSVSATARAIGSPFAASDSATNIEQSTRTNRVVRLRSLIRSFQAGGNSRVLFIIVLPSSRLSLRRHSKEEVARLM